VWDIVLEEKVVFSAALIGESVLSVVFTNVFVSIQADLPKSMDMFQVYGLFMF
jgi:hypothetical protein